MRPERPSSPERCSRSPSASSTPTPWRIAQSSAPGSTSPGLVAITRPATGVNPIVVSTDRPPATAASEAPAPMCAVTRRVDASGRPRRSAARLLAHAWLNPWNPKRRMPSSARQLRGNAYVAALAGRVAWKLVSKHATCTSPGRRRRSSCTASSAGGLCKGARSARRESCASDRESITSGSTNSAPPWTTRCPIASAGGDASRNPSSAAPTSSSSERRRSSCASSRSRSPSRLSFRLLDPAFTTSTRTSPTLPERPAFRRFRPHPGTHPATHPGAARAQPATSGPGRLLISPVRLGPLGAWHQPAC